MFGPSGAGSSRSSDDLHNEDAFLVSDELGLYAVCDGRGDAPGGEVAAYLATAALEDYVSGILGSDDDADRASDELTRPEFSAKTIEHAIRHALHSIVVATRERPDLAGMATTVTLLLVQRGRAFIGHAGDSRAYLVRGDDLVQLTTDQEWTTEGVGTSRTHGVEIESFSIATRPSDIFILCTDGAETQIANPALLDAMHEYSPRLLASRLVAAAHRACPDEDATAVVVRIRENNEFAWASLRDPRSELSDGRLLSLDVVGRRVQHPHPFDRLFARQGANAESQRKPGPRIRALAE